MRAQHAPLLDLLFFIHTKLFKMEMHGAVKRGFVWFKGIKQTKKAL